jgi:hypothetical protein
MYNVRRRPPYQAVTTTLFQPIHSAVNSTRYLQDTKGIAMATLRNKLIARLAKTTIVVPASREDESAAFTLLTLYYHHTLMSL